MCATDGRTLSLSLSFPLSLSSTSSAERLAGKGGSWKRIILEAGRKRVMGNGGRDRKSPGPAEMAAELPAEQHQSLNSLFQTSLFKIFAEKLELFISSTTILILHSISTLTPTHF